MELPDYLGYLIYEDGKIWSKKRKIYLKANQDGYNQVNLNGKRYFVHRLVALAYVPNMYNKSQVHHKNGITNDNRAENLLWVSMQENNHSIRKVNEPFGCIQYDKRNNSWKHILKVNYKQYNRSLPTQQEAKLYQLMLKYAFHRLYK